MNKLLMALLAFTATESFAACQTGNVYTDITCYQKQFKADKNSLNKLYSKLMTKLDSEGQSQLEQSQKAWLQYRNKQCQGLVAYSASETMGAGSGLIILECEAEKTRERLQELKHFDY